jgi:hypothetical protein
MQNITSEIFIGVCVIVVGAAVIAIAKTAIEGFISWLKLQITESLKGVVPVLACDKQHQYEAEERESDRKNIQNHEDRLNALGA